MAEETILVVDDDLDIQEIITLYLESAGYKVISAFDGMQAVEYALEMNPDLIILDMMLPGLDGIGVCKEIRKTKSIPIIFLSCKSTPNDKSVGLIAGGDDYMSKPFEAIELLARVNSQLRRNRILEDSNKAKPSNNIMSFNDLQIDINSFSVIANGQIAVLSTKEFQLLKLLAENPNTVFTNEELFNTVWGFDGFGDYRTVLVHISNIRKKIEKDPKHPTYIQTVRGVGYKFCFTK